MKKLAALLLAALLVLCAAGCSGQPAASATNAPATKTPAATQAPAQDAPQASADAAPEETSVYPIEGDYTFSYFGQFHKKLNGYYESYDDLEVVQWWKEAVGVEIEWNTPAASMEKEQFNIMLASGDFPDLINYSFSSYTGGAVALYNEGVLIRLDEYDVDTYAPNLLAFLGETPEFLKAAKDDEGHLYYFPITKQGTVQLASTGPLLRADLLADLGYDQLPTTIDQWDEILRAVKEKYPDVAPHIATWSKLRSAFQPAWGVSESDWYQDESGVVHYAYIEDAYKEFLMKMNTWYKDGLIDANLAQNLDTDIDTAMSAGTAFSCIASGGNGIGAYIDANADSETYSVAGCQYPTLDGSYAKFTGGWPFDRQVGITQSCKNPEIAMRVLDYGYSEEGMNLLNWGKEGVSYFINDAGEKEFFDEVIHNPDGLSVDASMAQYSIRHIKGPAPYISLEPVFLANYEKPEQKAACQLWADTTDWNYRSFPPVSYTEQESDDFTAIMADIETYADSMSMKFVLGSESFDNWDSYVQTIKSFGIDTALEIQQAACDRFNAR